MLPNLKASFAISASAKLTELLPALRDYLRNAPGDPGNIPGILHGTFEAPAHQAMYPQFRLWNGKLSTIGTQLPGHTSIVGEVIDLQGEELRTAVRCFIAALESVIPTDKVYKVTFYDQYDDALGRFPTLSERDWISVHEAVVLLM